MKNGSVGIPSLFGRTDVLAYVLVILAALMPIVFGNGRAEPQKAVVVCGETVTEYPLSEDRTLKIENNGITLTVVIANGEVCIESSDCRDGICRDTGKISKTGQIIICAPAMVAVRIEGETEGGYDAIIR